MMMYLHKTVFCVNKRKTMKPHLKSYLESLYSTYNRRRFVDPDPLLCLYGYPDKGDREIAGLIAACLAYGRVEMIMKAVTGVLKVLGPHPARWVASAHGKKMSRAFGGFRYRFAGEAHLIQLIRGMQDVLLHFGSLEACFVRGMGPEDADTVPGLIHLTRHLDPRGRCSHLLADPAKTSACKRSHLFLRWMVRRDRVDLGGWDRVGTDKLLVPLDVHMHRAGRLLGFTLRKSPDLKTAREITKGFRRLAPEDPVRYDFCLTRLGIQRHLDMDVLTDMATPRTSKE